MKIEGVVTLKELAELHQVERIITELEAFDSLTGGLVKGGVNEFFGHAGSGKRSVVTAILANLTRNNTVCMIVDTANSFDPVSAKKNGMKLDQVLWIQCDNDPQKAIVATDYLIRSNISGVIWLDLSLCEEDFLNRMPNSYWFRFKTGLKDQQTSLVITVDDAKLKSASHQSVEVTKVRQDWSGRANFKIPVSSLIKMKLVRPTLGEEFISIISDHQ